MGGLLGWVHSLIEGLSLGQALSAIIGLPGAALSIWGLYKAYKYSGKKLANILNDYLKAESEKIAERRRPILASIRNSSKAVDNGKRLELHETLDDVMTLFEKGTTKDKLKAEAILRSLADDLADVGKVAAERKELADRQAATVYLVSGSIAASRKDPALAIAAFKKVLDMKSDDADAIKYLGEQYLVLASVEQAAEISHCQKALEYFGRLEALNKDNSAARADALRLQARVHLRLGATGKAKACLDEAARLVEQSAADKLAAEIYELRGDACRGQAFWVEAEKSYSVGKALYDRLHDATSSSRIGSKMIKNQERSQQLSIDLEPPLIWEPPST